MTVGRAALRSDPTLGPLYGLCPRCPRTATPKASSSSSVGTLNRLWGLGLCTRGGEFHWFSRQTRRASTRRGLAAPGIRTVTRCVRRALFLGVQPQTSRGQGTGLSATLIQKNVFVSS